MNDISNDNIYIFHSLFLYSIYYNENIYIFRKYLYIYIYIYQIKILNNFHCNLFSYDIKKWFI